MIRKTGLSEYTVYAESGRRLGGPYRNLVAAKKRLAQVEYFKHKKSKKKRKRR